MKKFFYNPETEEKAEYTEVWKNEVIAMKDIKDLVVTTHYWEDDEGELWLDFDDPNENLRIIFDAYRKRKGYMQPEQVKKLRKCLKLSQRDFASRLGISYSKLSQIESNKRVQSLSQENVFRKAEYDYNWQGYLVNPTEEPSIEELLSNAAKIYESESLKSPVDPYTLGKNTKEKFFSIDTVIGGVA